MERTKFFVYKTSFEAWYSFMILSLLAPWCEKPRNIESYKWYLKLNSCAKTLYMVKHQVINVIFGQKQTMCYSEKGATLCLLTRIRTHDTFIKRGGRKHKSLGSSWILLYAQTFGHTVYHQSVHSKNYSSFHCFAEKFHIKRQLQRNVFLHFMRIEK